MRWPISAVTLAELSAASTKYAPIPNKTSTSRLRSGSCRLDVLYSGLSTSSIRSPSDGTLPGRRRAYSSRDRGGPGSPAAGAVDLMIAATATRLEAAVEHDKNLAISQAWDHLVTVIP